MTKNKGFSLVELMVVLAALGGVALLVTKLGKSSMDIQKESIQSNDYNDLVRETHFLLSNLKACKVSLAGTRFPANATSITNLELWTSNPKGETRVAKKFAKNEKFGSLVIEDVSLQLEARPLTPNAGDIQNTTGVLKLSLIKTKTNTPLPDIEHSIYLNYSQNQAEGHNTIIDCDSNYDVKEKAKVWCGMIQNPCGNETIQAVAIGKYEDGKFTGIFQSVTLIDGKICTGALNHPASFAPCMTAK